MKVRGQVVAAAAATVILFTAASGILLSSGSRTSFAEPLTKEGLTALEAAVANPTGALAAVLRQMDALQPGSGAQFVAALRTNTDTDAMANALQSLVAANGNLQVTITSALSALAASPDLPVLATTAGNYVNLPNLLSSDATRPLLTSVPPVRTNFASTDNQTGGDQNQTLADLNPAAPGSRFNGPDIRNPFTRPGQNRELDRGRFEDQHDHDHDFHPPVDGGRGGPGRGNSRE